MKLLSPWVCLMVTVASPLAYSGMSGVDAYREGHYFQARDKLSSASSGDPVANYYLGLMRLYGYGVLKNDVVALRFFKQAAERGILPAQQLMARYFLIHDNNPTEALYWFKKSADLNDTAAQMYCAAAYLFGVGVSKNSDVARRYYISASRNGNALAQYTLAQYFMESKQIASQRLGLIWLEKAVEKNEPGAQVLMGQVMAAGVLVPQDLDKAKALMQQALAQGYLKANLALGDLAHQQGDDALAKTYYEKSAADKDDAADLALGQLYLDSKSPLYHPETGFLLVLKSAQHEIKAAQKLLALLYKEGRGTAKDEHLAKEWENRAKKTAVSTLSSAVEAVRWLTHNKASTWVASGYGLQGILTQWSNQHALIQNIYNQSPQMDRVLRSELYQPKFVMREPNQIPLIEYYDAIVKATGTPNQKVVNFPRYPLAQTTVTPHLEEKAILGDSDAQFQLGQCYQQGSGVTKDIQKAIKYYAQATALQDLRAEYNLGLIWLEAETGTPDYQQAMGWLNDAAFKGNVEAQYVLGQILQHGYQNAQHETVIQPDVDQALSLYHLASAMQYGPAEYELAELLVRDQTTALNLAEKQKRMAIMKSLYQDAVLKGVKEAALPLAFFDAMSSDKLKQAHAYEVAEQAALENNPQATLLYAMLLDRGLGVDVDHDKAISWYEKFPESPISAFILGTYATLGDDLEKGRSLLEKSAQSGFSYAHLNLSIVDKKQNKTFLPSLIEAHRLGNTTASLLLADYYLTGAQDDTALNEARSIYQRLAEKGDKHAQLKMGYML
ncbi:MAG: tetratricopeptide repeat protein, partial [Legionellaceae bacterium]